MNKDDLRQAITLGREQRGTEFKGPGKRTDKHFRARVVRAILGMSNKPGGGNVIIGVDDDGSALNPTGLTADEISTWSYDDLASNVSTYADPYIDFDVSVVQLDGDSFVVVTVSQFERLPVICKRDYQGVLRNGAMYVRRRGKNETVEVPSHVEMREVLERAAEIVAREIVASHEMLTTSRQTKEDALKTFSAKFDNEAEDLL
ncbi:ATP-binding protein [Roseiconus nitratireducens]|uniref:ATP-binding protein n=1 Tax=Roseiconus nitratireducens TaxID=2605748 RepID=A0A5M6D553_9BACT|nr:ATP-binding protein [Roseiconus nitratireducens]KAA5541886.1 ATP-binding protein [Roseiconus nitratireducens]